MVTDSAIAILIGFNLHTLEANPVDSANQVSEESKQNPLIRAAVEVILST